MMIEFSRLDSPIGSLVLAASSEGLCALDFTDSELKVRERLQRAHPDARFSTGPLAKRAAARVKAYFWGDLAALDALAVDPSGTEFQKQVWAALREIPAGETASYGKIAASIGRPTAVRAVGAANGRNPIALVVPCHRIIGADGTLCGYAGGLWRKQWLLKHERALLA